MSQSSIDVNKGSEKTNQSPLFYASWFGHIEIVRMLLEKPNVDVKKKTKNGHTALSYAKSDEIKALIRAKLDGREIPQSPTGRDFQAILQQYGNDADALIRAAKAGVVEDVKKLKVCS